MVVLAEGRCAVRIATVLCQHRYEAEHIVKDSCFAFPLHFLTSCQNSCFGKSKQMTTFQRTRKCNSDYLFDYFDPFPKKPHLWSA